VAVTERLAARALVLSPERRILLLKFRFPWREIDMWITPGGGIEPGEDARAAVIRELHEETGLVLHEPGREIWTRDHLLAWSGREVLLRERYFLVEVAEFEPRPVALGAEADWFLDFRWWPLDEIPDSGEEFAPSRLGALTRTLLREGPPPRPTVIPI
jgi:8-oxo-dGTP pyrophosphatase MutT (NUDIX family)